MLFNSRKRLHINNSACQYWKSIDVHIEIPYDLNYLSLKSVFE
jgi:hypothetical protein